MTADFKRDDMGTAPGIGPAYVAGGDITGDSSGSQGQSNPVLQSGASALPVNVSGQLLGKFLTEHNYHPVIFCGTAAAGKTTMLASLCAFLRTSGAASFDFGEWFDISSSPEAVEAFSEAQRFFRDLVKDFINGASPESTHLQLPYIIPLVVTPTNAAQMPLARNGSPRPVKFAMMDMRGEFFKPSTSFPINRPMPPDAQSLLQSFDGAISMVYLAPTTRIDGFSVNGISRLEPHRVEDREISMMEDPDEALLNAIRAYENTRPTRSHDRHLFVLSKWDLKTKGTESPDFAEPLQEDIERFLTQQYSSSWAQFRAMRADREAKWFVQYSAGLIDGRQVLPQSGESAAKLKRYSQVMWNWLYQGATRTESDREGKLIFPTTEAKPKPTLLRWLAGR